MPKKENDKETKQIRCPFCNKTFRKDDAIVKEYGGYYHLWCSISASESPADYGYDGDAC